MLYYQTKINNSIKTIINFVILGASSINNYRYTLLKSKTAIPDHENMGNRYFTCGVSIYSDADSY